LRDAEIGYGTQDDPDDFDDEYALED